MVCGRKRDLEATLQYLIEGKSVTLFGERRIGKTLSLYLVRDIIDGSIHQYKSQLLDRDLLGWLENLDAELPHLHEVTRCEFFSLQTLEQRTMKAFAQTLQKRFPDASVKRPESLHDILQRLDITLSGRLVILIDEMEELLDTRFDDPGLVFQQLNSVIQTCGNISFVFAGADNWVRAVRDGTSPLYGNCSSHFLASPDNDSLKTYLLSEPLTQFMEDQNDRAVAVAGIMVQSGGKPFYCQALAYEVATGCGVDGALEKADSFLRNSIQDFFSDPPEPGCSILALLAHRPLLTESQIRKSLATPKQELVKTLVELRSLGKVRYNSGLYALNGQLFENWGNKNLDMPEIRSSWPNRLKWVLRVSGAAAAIVALGLIVYTHPQSTNFTCRIAQGTIVLSLPGSVERGEDGEGSLHVIANSDGLKSLKLHAVASAGELWAKEGEAWEFGELLSNERSQKKTVYFRIPHDAQGSMATFKLITVTSQEGVEFQVPIRKVPLKRYWLILAIFGGALAVVGGIGEKLLKLYGPFGSKSAR